MKEQLRGRPTRKEQHLEAVFNTLPENTQLYIRLNLALRRPEIPPRAREEVVATRDNLFSVMNRPEREAIGKYYGVRDQGKKSSPYTNEDYPSP